MFLLFTLDDVASKFFYAGLRCCRFLSTVSDMPLLILLCTGSFPKQERDAAAATTAQRRRSNSLQANNTLHTSRQPSFTLIPSLRVSPRSLWSSSFVHDNVQVVNMQGARGHSSPEQINMHKQSICCHTDVSVNIGAGLWSCSRMQIIGGRYRGIVWRLIDTWEKEGGWWLMVGLWCSQFEVQTKTRRGVSPSEPARSQFFSHTFQSQTFWSRWLDIRGGMRWGDL